MALFSLRKPRKEQAAPPSPTETVEAVRRRALHRLIGAAVLVIAGVIGFPLIFDSQPRPIPVDLPIEIADKDKVPPLQAPPAQSTAPPAAAQATPEAQEPAPAAPAAPEPPRATVAEAPAPVAPHPVPRAESVPAPAGPATPTAPPATRPADTADAQRARALLDGRGNGAASAATSASAPAASARFVVQVGAFAEESTLREVRRKVERAGLKTYTQTVSTKDGARTRVRVGPFEDRSKAQQAADTIRQLGLSPSVLTL